MFVDEVEIHVAAGHGGRGALSFRREKFVPRGGPNGGDGGPGGSVYLVANPNLNTLLNYRYQKKFEAGRGAHGEGSNRTGKNGADIELEVPVGTVVFERSGDEFLQVADLTAEWQRVLIARGGLGGHGNAHFVTSTNRAPRKTQPGLPGEEKDLRLQLKLLADVGLVGYPNAGKSTLISRISAARPKIADYPFTTLEPNLGIVELDPERRFVVADVPGLIADAHLGKGLGLEFLRHIERTRVLLLMVDVGAESPAEDLAMVERELREYSPALSEKPRLVILTKADTLPEDELGAAAAGAGFPGARVVSAHSGRGIPALLEELWKAVSAASEVSGAGTAEDRAHE